MPEMKKLTMDEYCKLFQNVTLAEYDNLFLNSDLRNDLGLDHEQTRRFAVEYLCAALYLLDDLVPDSGLPEETAHMLTAQVRTNIFRGILPEQVPEGAEAAYLMYSLRRSAAFAACYVRGDEGMRAIIENCLDQAGIDDASARMTQSLYLMQLLPGVLQLYCDLLRGVHTEQGESLRFCIDWPDKESNTD